MKNIGLIIGCCSMLLGACGDEGNKVEQDNSTTEEVIKPEKNPALKGMVGLDLSRYDLPLYLPVPDTNRFPALVKLQDWGDTEILSGKSFQLQIAEGGDLALKKNDLQEDLMYKSTLIDETEEGFIYKSEIDDESVKPTFHFYLVRNINGVNYEIRDIVGEKSFSEKQIVRMFEASKTMRAAE